jgi:hypothetical protein
MTTLLHLSQTIVDMQQELAREQRFGQDALAALLKGVTLLRDATDALERDIKTALGERHQAISRVLGSDPPPNITMAEPGYQIDTERALMAEHQAAYQDINLRAKLVG